MDNTPILLDDLLQFKDNARGRVKVKFNIYNGSEDPLKLWLADKEKINNEWLFWHKKRRYFKKGDIAICLVRISYPLDLWLLTTIQEVTALIDIHDGVGYEGRELEEYSKYFGRVKIKYHKSTQGAGFLYESISDELVVNEILPSHYEDAPFPGFDNVNVDFPTLERIVSPSGGRNSWTEALEHQKGVYLITDKSNGKHYVGSAYGENGMLLNRWRRYAETGHGDNAKLKELIKKQGIEHARKNFCFSILEIFDSCTSVDEIIKREHRWIDILDSRDHGYNSN